MSKDVIVAADLGGTPLTPDELAAIPELSTIRKEIWGKFPGAIARKDFRAGEILFREGDSGNTAFLLLSGEVQLSLDAARGLNQQPAPVSSSGLFGNLTRLGNYLKGVPEKRKSDQKSDRTHIPIDGPVDLPIDNPLAHIRAGEIFGELSALAALKQEKLKRAKFYPRSATARALSDVVVLEMLPNILNNVLYNSPAFKDKLNKNYRERALDTQLRSVPALSGLSQEFLDYLREKAELVDAIPGQVICKQGDLADSFYLIRMGFVKVSQQFPGGEMVLNYISRGSYFGEIGLLPPVFRLVARNTEGPQTAIAVIAREPITAGRNPSGNNILRITWDEYISREHFLIQVEGAKARVKRLQGGKNPLKFQGANSDSFLIGPGESFQLGNTIFELKEDDYLSGRRMATCTAMDFCQLVRIKSAEFARMLAEYPEVEAAIAEVARARRQMNAQLMSRVSTVYLDDFLELDLMQGQNLLLIDLEKCTRCDECARACVATHPDRIPRLLREGLRFDKYLVPTSCRACLDPLCMTRCPVGSIRRKQTLDIVIEDWCIGCGNCAIDCPYGNINVVKIGDGQKAEPRPKATVCDLCADYSEPNCVRACPHDAALRVDPKRFFARDLAGVPLNVPTAAPAAVPFEESPLLQETRIHTNIGDLMAMLPRLRVKSGLQEGQTLQLRFPSTSLGRAAECDLRFEDDGISRVHCTIFLDRSKAVVKDNESTNGTLVNGQPVAETELRNGDIISVGDVDLEYLSGRMQ
ncbi:MAG: cyclic nucleotide-binding domain-containing protein [Bryobacteraceae bacterium]